MREPGRLGGESDIVRHQVLAFDPSQGAGECDRCEAHEASLGRWKVIHQSGEAILCAPALEGAPLGHRCRIIVRSPRQLNRALAVLLTNWGISKGSGENQS